MTVNSRFTDVTCITPTITAGQSYIMDLTLGNIFCWGVQGHTRIDSTTGGRPFCGLTSYPHPSPACG
jgi:hypothetical protein